MSDQKYDVNKIAPGSTMSLANLRSNPESLHQGDFLFLRPLTFLLVDDFEYTEDADMASAWYDVADAGEMTITSESVLNKYGNYCLKVVIDSSPSDPIQLMMKNENLQTISDLSLMKMGKIYLRTTNEDSSGDTIKLRIMDTSANESYWDLLIPSANTWYELSFDLTVPDGNNGTDADLSDISAIYFDDFENGETYYIDNFKIFVGNTMVVDGISYLGSSSPYHSHVWGQDANGNMSLFEHEREIAPEISLPSGDARWDLLVYKVEVPSGTHLDWVEGEEGSSTKPLPDNDHIPICYVRTKPTQEKVVELSEADANPDEGYVGVDCRNFVQSFLLNQLGLNTKISTGGGYFSFYAINPGDFQYLVAVLDTHGLSFYRAGVLAGTYLNKFSTDGTLAGNNDHTAVSEKAIKTYVDSLIPKHYISPGKISYSGDEIVVEPRVLSLEGVLLSEASNVNSDVTDSGNYVGTDMSGTEGYVYIYLKDDGSGGYDVLLSGDAPNRSDASAGATTGKLIYRDFSGTWHVCIGVRYKLAGALSPFYVSDDGLVIFEDFLLVAESGVGTGDLDADYDSQLPSMINLGIFSVEMTTQSADVPSCKIRPKGSTGDYLFVAPSSWIGGTAGGQIWCHAGTDNEIRVVIDKVSTSSSVKISLAGYKDIR